LVYIANHLAINLILKGIKLSNTNKNFF